MARSKTDSRIIKFSLNNADHSLVRLAAALAGTNMADARRMTAGVKRPGRSSVGKHA